MILMLAALLTATGCVDEMLENPDGGDFPEGSTKVSMALDFEPFATRDGEKTRSLGGKAMDRLDDLCLVAYDREGNLMTGFPIEITKAAHGLTVTSEPRDKAHASNGTSAESSTRHAKFKVEVPYGNYYLYAVANLGRYDEAGNRLTSTYQELTEGGTWHEAAQKRTTLLEARMSWDDHWLNNCEMFGFMTRGKEEKSPSTGTATNDRRITIDKPGLTVHGWLRRCASKVTIDFDGSQLRDNISIHIRRATIHDIPDGCLLGMPSAILAKEQMISNKDADYRPQGGDHIDYGEGDNPDAWPAISNKNPYLVDAAGKRRNLHAEDAEAMFLYENMQGVTEGDPKNKEQHPAPDGTVVGADTDKKDNVELGSYIEVEAYYLHTTTNHVSKGRIIYRFMLGKDALKDFNVERNHHFKLTMKVRGNGNDVDWHIEYTEDTGFEVRNPYYVSYLYNHESTLRFRYTPPAGKKAVRLEAEIVGNNWWPDITAGENICTEAMSAQNPLKPEEQNDPLKASFSRNKYTEDDILYTDDKTSVKIKDTYPRLVGRTKYLGNGFLSLREVANATNVTPGDNDITNMIDWIKDGASRKPYSDRLNDLYFYGLSKSSNGIDRSKRSYNIADPGADKDNKDKERYEVQRSSDGSLVINIPAFTRAKNLIKQTGFSGNNPYEGSTRSAYVRLTMELDDGTKDSQIIRVEQVRRLINPKGIWRKSGNNENFAVRLLERTSADAAEYTEFKSDGPWIAEVIGDHNFINLNGRSTIKGSGGVIAFNVRFNKMNRDDKVRNAVIRIRYNNYSCVHLIFVRQGYSSQSIEGHTSTQWHTFNKIHGALEADDPRDEGSLFRFGNLTDPIDAVCNTYGIYGTVPHWKFTAAGSLDIVGSDGKLLPTGKTWGQIKPSAAGFPYTDVAQMTDFQSLWLDKDMKQGFGVLYADGATTVQEKLEDAYGWYRRDTPEVRDKRGMQGVFVYNNNDCRNIFFPLGRQAMGHRRNFDEKRGDGTLRYSAGRTAAMDNSLAPFMPLLFDIFNRRGAIYWARLMDPNEMETATGTKEDSKNSIGLDINYFTFDFNLITYTNVCKAGGWGSTPGESDYDACFVRGVGAQTHVPSKVRRHSAAARRAKARRR